MEWHKSSASKKAEEEEISELEILGQHCVSSMRGPLCAFLPPLGAKS